MTKLHEWELVNEEVNARVWRMKVPSGWIYDVAINNVMNSVFVPDQTKCFECGGHHILTYINCNDIKVKTKIEVEDLSSTFYDDH